MQPIIDEKTKSYLVACLVTGIDVTDAKASELMPDLVSHMNSTERIFWSQGDEDGIIIHDKNDVPLLYVMYNGERMSFNAFEMDEFTAVESQKEIGFALLNIIGFLQSSGFEFGPSILGSESHVVAKLSKDTLPESNPEDWSL